MQIEKNIPMPSHIGNSYKKKNKYPFKAMDVGDSVFIEGAVSGGNEYMAAYMYGRRTGRHYAGEQQGNGLRIWRVR